MLIYVPVSKWITGGIVTFLTTLINATPNLQWEIILVANGEVTAPWPNCKVTLLRGRKLGGLLRAHRYLRVQPPGLLLNNMEWFVPSFVLTTPHRLINILHGTGPQEVAQLGHISQLGVANVGVSASSVVACYRLDKGIVGMDTIISRTPFLGGLRAASTTPTAVRLCYLGRLSEADKGVSNLQPICAALTAQGTQYSLGIIGEGPARPALERALAPYPVTFHGNQTTVAAHQLLTGYDAILLVSNREGWGLAVVEGMEAGCIPIIRPTAVDLAAWISEYDCGFVGDVTAMPDYIHRLAQQPVERQALQAKLPHIVNHHLGTITEMVTAYRHLFARVHHASPPAGNPLFRVLAGAAHYWRTRNPHPSHANQAPV